MTVKSQKKIVARKRKSPVKSAATTASYARYLKMALKLPETEESTSYGTPSIKVKGKILSRLRTEAEGALAIYCDFIDREMLLHADPNVFFITDHYKNYLMILIRLDKIRADALAEITARAWRMRAPKKLVDEFDSQVEVREIITTTLRHSIQTTYPTLRAAGKS